MTRLKTKKPVQNICFIHNYITIIPRPNHISNPPIAAVKLDSGWRITVIAKPSVSRDRSFSS